MTQPKMEITTGTHTNVGYTKAVKYTEKDIDDGTIEKGNKDTSEYLLPVLCNLVSVSHTLCMLQQ